MGRIVTLSQHGYATLEFIWIIFLKKMIGFIIIVGIKTPVDGKLGKKTRISFMIKTYHRPSVQRL